MQSRFARTYPSETPLKYIHMNTIIIFLKKDIYNFVKWQK